MCCFAHGIEDRENKGTFYGRKHFLTFHDDKPVSRLNAICDGTEKVILKFGNVKKDQYLCNMRKEDEPIKIICNGDDLTSTHDIIVHSRINNCGTKFNTEESQRTLSLFDEKITCTCLSISNKRWIGDTGMSKYIVELVKKPIGKELKIGKKTHSHKW